MIESQEEKVLNKRIKISKNPSRNPTVASVIGAVCSGILGYIIAILNPTPAPELSTMVVVVGPDGNYVKIVNPSVINKEENKNSVTLEIKLSNDQISGIISEPIKPLGFFVPELKEQKIIYADQKHQIKMVKEWLENDYSGYPQLLKSLKNLLNNRKGQGNPVPLTIIMGKYSNDTSNPPTIYDKERLKQAYIKAWKEKNSGSTLTELNQIAPLSK